MSDTPYVTHCVSDREGCLPIYTPLPVRYVIICKQCASYREGCLVTMTGATRLPTSESTRAPALIGATTLSRPRTPLPVRYVTHTHTVCVLTGMGAWKRSLTDRLTRRSPARPSLLPRAFPCQRRRIHIYHDIYRAHIHIQSRSFTGRVSVYPHPSLSETSYTHMQ
jgi:hypothetical protein